MATLANFNIAVTVPEGVLPAAASELSSDRNKALLQLADFFTRLAGGNEPGAPGDCVVSLQKGTTAAAAVRASGTITFSGASGTVGSTIAGVAKTAAHGASDNADATAHAAAINADATLSKLVEATANANVVTVTALQPGVTGNQITTVASGTGVSASGAKLTGGVGADGAPTTLTF